MTFDTIGIAGSGLTVHRKWLDAVSDNIANANTAKSTDGAAFQARYILAQEGEGMVPAGLMEASNGTFLMEGDAAQAIGAGITVEPAGGSDEPTLPPVTTLSFENA